VRLIDTIKIACPLEDKPQELINRTESPFIWNTFKWTPMFNGHQELSFYKAKFKNLDLKLYQDKLILVNSLHKLYLGNNYMPFTYGQVIKALLLLNHHLPLDVYQGEVKRLSFGVVIKEHPESIYNQWLFHLGKPWLPMQSGNKMYGAKFYLTDYQIKGYNKTTQVQKQSALVIPENLFRFEIDNVKTKVLNNATNNVGVYKVMDILEYSKYQKLGDVLLRKFSQIEKHPQLQLSNLNIKEKRLVASMQNYQIKESIKKQHFDSYKNDKKKYNQIQKIHADNYFQEHVFQKLKSAVEYSINN